MRNNAIIRFEDDEDRGGRKLVIGTESMTYAARLSEEDIVALYKVVGEELTR